MRASGCSFPLLVISMFWCGHWLVLFPLSIRLSHWSLFCTSGSCVDLASRLHHSAPPRSPCLSCQYFFSQAATNDTNTINSHCHNSNRCSSPDTPYKHNKLNAEYKPVVQPVMAPTPVITAVPAFLQRAVCSVVGKAVCLFASTSSRQATR